MGPMVRSDVSVGQSVYFYEGLQAEARRIGRHSIHVFKD